MIQAPVRQKTASIAVISTRLLGAAPAHPARARAEYYDSSVAIRRIFRLLGASPTLVVGRARSLRTSFPATADSAPHSSQRRDVDSKGSSPS